MSRIDILHPRSQPDDQARQMLDQIADKLADRFGVRCEWVQDTLCFKGSGVDGRIALEPEQVRVTADLGFLLSAMKGPIEAEIRRVLQERFG